VTNLCQGRWVGFDKKQEVATLVLPSDFSIFRFRKIRWGFHKGERPFVVKMRLLIHIRCCIARDIAAEVDAHTDIDPK
jgi:hypothetical protein